MKKVDCPMCGGYGFDGIEEDTGCQFACYFCGTTGKVDAAVIAEIESEQQQLADQASSLAKRMVRCRYDPEGYDGCIAQHSNLFTRLDYGMRRKPLPIDELEDIPF